MYIKGPDVGINNKCSACFCTQFADGSSVVFARPAAALWGKQRGRRAPAQLNALDAATLFKVCRRAETRALCCH